MQNYADLQLVLNYARHRRQPQPIVIGSIASAVVDILSGMLSMMGSPTWSMQALIQGCEAAPWRGGRRHSGGYDCSCSLWRQALAWRRPRKEGRSSHCTSAEILPDCPGPQSQVGSCPSIWAILCHLPSSANTGRSPCNSRK